MSRKWFNNKIPQKDTLTIENKLAPLCKETVKSYMDNFNSYKLDIAANDILNLAINTNLYLNEMQPWVLIKKESNVFIVREIIYNVLESIRIIGLLLLPILPELSSKIDEQLGCIYNDEDQWVEQLKWGKLIANSPLPKPFPIISKLDYE